MANYVFAYSGGKGVSADEAERNAQYAKWGQWFGQLGSAVVEGGAAMGTAKTVGPGGSVRDGGSCGLTGYSIVSADLVTLDVCRYDPVTQLLDENHVTIAADGITLGPISLRLAHPPEFDLMARIAGLRLCHRTGGWFDEPFTATSWRHVSVYERIAARRPS